MKYTFTGSPATSSDRHRKNLEVANNITDLPNDYVFNNFTGLGGLHGLNFKDYASFSDYTEAKKTLELGQFFTPPELCLQILQSIKPPATDKVADFTCGSGNFFNYLPEVNCFGCEIETDAYRVVRKLYPNATLLQGDFTAVTFDQPFDLVVGNPPFNIKTKGGRLSQYAYIKKAAEYLKPGKILAFIAPQTFLADEYTNRHKWEEIATDFDFICQSEIPAHYFDVDISIKILYFRRAGVNRTGRLYENVYTDFDPVEIYQNYIQPIQQDNVNNAAALHLHTIRQATGDRYGELIKKYLYQIKAHKTLKRKFYQPALDQIHLLNVQTRPEGMKADDWEEIKLTPAKVANWIKERVKHQNDPPPKKIVKLVKTNYGFKSKAYCPTLKKDQTEQSMIELILAKKQLRQPGYNKLLQKKIKAYELQNKPFSAMKRDEAIDNFLEDFSLSDSYGEGGRLNLFAQAEKIKLNDKQKLDLGLAFQKKYFILNWQQGGGKSVAGMAWLNFIQDRVKNIFIIAPSLAVQLTWKPRLTKYGYRFVWIEKFTQLADVKPGEIIILSFDMVRMIERHLRRFVKLRSYKIALIVDESDELTNFSSQRTRSALSCFRKAPYKALTTGTTTRNTINEIYPQLELLYNNSVNLLCWTQHIWKENKEKQLVKTMNTAHHGRPFPPFHGHNLFKYSFCPQRTTVFGVKQDTQDIYNSDELKDILDKTVITRTFDDIVGKRIYKIKNHQVLQNAEEKRLYSIIIEEFYQIVYNYYANTGNSRKEAMLRLIRQITLLIQSTSIPHTFPHYPDKRVLPAKFYKVRDLVREWEGEKVAIGTVMVEAAKEYQTFLMKQFPNRRVFYIDGLKSFPARKKIIAEFQATRDGILISTQQSLKSSVDIETCDKCILESLQWNLPKMSQYYFRFIRYNSKKEKEIHFVTYADSIEQNILALLMCKEKLNEFIKNPDEVATREELFSEYGIDAGILSQIIEKVYDSEGNLHLRWGNQTISKQIPMSMETPNL